MPTQNSSNQKFTNNADGFALGGGTTQRNLTISGSDVNIVGTGSSNYTLPSTTDTLIGRSTVDTLANKTISTTNNSLSNLTDVHFSASAAIAISKLGTGRVSSNVNGIATSTVIWRGTQAQYDAIGSKDSNTIYTVAPGPPVTYIESTSISNTGGNTTPNRTQSLTLPPNRQVGDLMVIITSIYNGNAATPSGWSFGLSTTTSSTQRVTLMYRFCDGTEGSAVTVVVDNSDSTLHTCLLFRNVNTTTPIDGGDVSSTTSASTTHTTPFIPVWPTANIERSLVVRGAVTYGASAASNYTWPAGWTEIIDSVAVTSGDSSLSWTGIAVKPLDASNLISTVDATSTINQRYSSFTFILNAT